MFKIGHTTKDVAARIRELDECIRESGELGRFDLVLSVPVAEAYEAEQAAFRTLAGFRMGRGKEFFDVAPEALLTGLLSACHEHGIRGQPPSQLQPPGTAVIGAVMGGHPAPTITDGVGPADEWVFVAHNPAYLAGTYRVGHTKFRPAAWVRKQNKANERRTSQTGFYALAGAWPATDARRIVNATLQRMCDVRPDRRRPFLRTDIRFVISTIEAALDRIEGREAAGVDDTDGSEQLVDADLVQGDIDSRWARWVLACPKCRAVIRIRGAIGSQSPVTCPLCVDRFAVRVGAHGITMIALAADTPDGSDSPKLRR